METNQSIYPKKRLTTKRLVFIGVFAAIAYVVGMFSFPIFPATPYFKLDFANVFILLSGFLFGPIAGVVVCIIKELLSLINTTTGGVGELANVIMTSAFILFPAIMYRKHKGLPSVIRSLVVACLIGTAAALIVNRFIIFPMYMGEGAASVYNKVFWFCVAFNLIKTGVICLLTLLMYKRLSNFIHKIEDKDDSTVKRAD